MTGEPLIRLLQEQDWPRIHELEAQAYAELGLSEDPQALRSRAAASPATNFVVVDGERVVGYLLTLPYPAGRFPDLARGEAAAHDERANLHLHDIVIDRRYQVRGLPEQLLAVISAAAAALGFEQLSMVSLRRSRRRWTRMGFVEQPEVAVPASYGEGAGYLTYGVGA
ncbi:GNAT family N-acetyltransferase [Streptomyces tateyamensis]|uniref:GNAT family N-acetyltransferase n=1 Tax=Streptomyces tateyamensis TaxID=565073 RepID=A0A2V4NVU0_9ACTN|nr:GNAT family N-acetyltransferase [Streptomyces tateyamensis]PYC72070.1 GNAT family N-acetyltransferase [Streptomyces tateyamensis]